MSLSKGQFFIVTAFVIISILLAISKWLEPATILEVSEIAVAEEPFVLNNIAEKAVETVKVSKSCEELGYNLQEYKAFAESYASGKGYMLDFDYTLTDCSSVDFKISLKSPRASLTSQFSCPWP
jgi:hypothetical protein